MENGWRKRDKSQHTRTARTHGRDHDIRPFAAAILSHRSTSDTSTLSAVPLSSRPISSERV
jgi:hypothetical protein